MPSLATRLARPPGALTPPRTSTLIVLSGLSVVSLNLLLPSLTNIAATFGVSYATANLAVSGYLAMTAVLQMILGPLSDLVGRRRVMLWSVGVFTIASLGCVLAGDITTFLACRATQGAIASGMTLSRAIIRDTNSQTDATKLLGLVGAVMAIGPLLAPMVGGGLDELFGWRAGFWLFTALGAVALAICWFDLGETNTRRAAGFGAQFRTYPDLLRVPEFWIFALCITSGICTFLCFAVGVPLVGETRLGLSPAGVGLFMGLITVGFIAGNVISGRLAGQVALGRLIALGRGIATVGPVIALVCALLGMISVWTMFVPIILSGFGNGLSLPGANAGIMSVRPRLAGSAAGLSGAMSIAVGGLLTYLTGAVLTPDNGPIMLALILSLVTGVGFAAALALPRDTDTGPAPTPAVASNPDPAPDAARRAPPPPGTPAPGPGSQNAMSQDAGSMEPGPEDMRSQDTGPQAGALQSAAETAISDRAGAHAPTARARSDPKAS